MTTDICQISVINQAHVDQAVFKMPQEQFIAEAAEVFSMLGDMSRLRILHALSTTELCVCDLASILESSSSAVSHQLRLLRAKGMVRFRKAGKIAYYSLTDAQVQQLIFKMFDHLYKVKTEIRD